MCAELHVNVGASQFHLLLKSSYADRLVPVVVAQVWAGHIELWTHEPLDAIQQRLTAAGRMWNREEASAASGGLRRWREGRTAAAAAQFPETLSTASPHAAPFARAPSPPS